jgi:hypothetical protein
MVRKQRSSRLATVTKIPVSPPRKRGRPKTQLTSAVDDGERDMLVVLRRKLATRIDECDIPTALAALVRQFRDVDARIRALDLAAALAADDEADEDDEDDEETGWDPSKV